MYIVQNNPLNDDVLISLDDLGELDKYFIPEYVARLKKHLELQGRWRKILKDREIDCYLGEAMSMDILSEKFKDSVFWDIGCSVGMWSIVALECGARRVYGFDPLPDNKVDSEKFTRFITKIGKEPSIDFIATTSLEKPNTIKIDVEGDEMEVLEGAIHVIKKYKPVLIIEAHEILFSDEPDKRKVTGNKQKVIDFLKPYYGEPSEILDQNIKDMGVVYHIIYSS